MSARFADKKPLYMVKGIQHGSRAEKTVGRISS